MTLESILEHLGEYETAALYLSEAAVAICRAFFVKPSDGLEPSTPSLQPGTWDGGS